MPTPDPLRFEGIPGVFRATGLGLCREHGGGGVRAWICPRCPRCGLRGLWRVAARCLLRLEAPSRALAGVFSSARSRSLRGLGAGSQDLVDTIKLVAYRAETAMAAVVREALPVGRREQARRLLQSLYTSEADLVPDATAGTLTARLAHPANPLLARALASLCAELTQTPTEFPTTKLRLVFKLVSREPGATQEQRRNQLATAVLAASCHAGNSQIDRFLLVPGLDSRARSCEEGSVRVIERFFSGVPHPHLLGVCHSDIFQLNLAGSRWLGPACRALSSGPRP